LKIEFYQDLYRLELERREQLNGALSLPVGLLTLLGGLLVIMLKESSWIGGAAQVVFLILVGAATVSLLASAVQLARSFWGYSFQYLAKSKDLLQWHSKLVSHFREFGSPDTQPELEAEREFETRAIGRLAEATSFNATQNDRRSEHLFWANGLVLLTLVLTGLAGIPYALTGPRTVSQTQGETHDQPARAASSSPSSSKQDRQVSASATTSATGESSYAGEPVR